MAASVLQSCNVSLAPSNAATEKWSMRSMVAVSQSRQNVGLGLRSNNVIHGRLLNPVYLDSYPTSLVDPLLDPSYSNP